MKLLEHLLVALRNFRGYDCRVHPHGESVLTDCNNKGAYSPLRAFFMRTTSMRSHIRYASCEGRTPLGVQVTFIACLSTDPRGLRQSFDSDVQAFNQNKGAH